MFNHVDIKITYHSGGNEGWKGARLVAATMEPKRYVYVAWSTGRRVCPSHVILKHWSLEWCGKMCRESRTHSRSILLKI